MSDRFEALRRAIIETGDEEAYLVLADHLQQVGDPRGELILLEHRAKEAGEDPADAREFFRANREALIGTLAEVEPYLSGVRWKLGFVRQANLHLPDDEPMQAARRVVQTALDAPAMQLIERLSVVVGASDEPAGAHNDLERVVISALCSKPRPSVRSLNLSVLGAGRVSMKLLGDALPNLESVSITSQRISFGGLKSSGVRTMNLFTSAIPVASFRSVEWRALESLALTASIDGSLTELLRAVPALTAFAISAPKNVEVIGSLLESGVAARLVRLRIDPIGKRELDALLAAAPKLARLARLEIADRHHDLLRPVFPHVEIADPMGPPEAEEDAGIDYLGDRRE